MKRALIVIDLQNGVCYGEQQLFHLDEMIVRVNQRIETYRNQRAPIIFVQHEDSDLVKDSVDWQLHPGLQTKTTDLFIDKTHANSFYQTNLQQILQSKGVAELEIWGAQTQYCVDSTVKFAHGLGYPIFMETGGSTTVNNEFMNAEETIAFYERIWNHRFITLKSTI